VILKPILNFWFMIAILLGVAFLFLLLPLFKEKSSNVKRFIYFIYVPIFVIASVGLYGYWGAHEKVQDLIALQSVSQTVEKLGQQPTLKPEAVAAEFDKLAVELDASAPALARLGMLSIELGWYDKAATLYERAREIDPDQSDYWVQWVYSHSLQNQGKLPAAVREQALLRLQETPNVFGLVNILAIDDFIQGDYSKAIKGWQSLLQQDAELSPERREVLVKAIAKARNQLIPSAQIAFNIKVDIDAALKAKMQPDDAVFILVRKQNSAGMPIYVTRRLARELPFTVRLDEQHSMTGMIELTPDQAVEVVAKVSKTGDPLEKSGDLRGISEKIVVKSGENPATVIINQSV
jgi:cytochrome c-type biogenesis protein CcmH